MGRMDLVLWRTAEAEEGSQDLERGLTSKGRKQCERVAAWLDQRLPSRFLLLCSPARRARQTAESLGIPAKPDDALRPGAAASDVLRIAGWPTYKGTSVIVGHQPDLGEVLRALLANGYGCWTIKKGGLWWLTTRVRDGEEQVIVRAVVSPEML